MAIPQVRLQTERKGVGVWKGWGAAQAVVVVSIHAPSPTPNTELRAYRNFLRTNYKDFVRRVLGMVQNAASLKMQVGRGTPQCCASSVLPPTRLSPCDLQKRAVQLALDLLAAEASLGAAYRFPAIFFDRLLRAMVGGERDRVCFSPFLPPPSPSPPKCAFALLPYSLYIPRAGETVHLLRYSNHLATAASCRTFWIAPSSRTRRTSQNHKHTFSFFPPHPCNPCSSFLLLLLSFQKEAMLRWFATNFLEYADIRYHVLRALHW